MCNVGSKDRNQRFGVVITVPGGALDAPVLGCLGHGDSFVAALDHADQNPIAQAIAKEWKQTQADWEEFRIDPVGYKNKKLEEIGAVLKET